MNSNRRRRNRPHSGPSPPRDPFDDWLALARALVLRPCKRLLQTLIRCITSSFGQVKSMGSHREKHNSRPNRRFDRP